MEIRLSGVQVNTFGLRMRIEKKEVVVPLDAPRERLDIWLSHRFPVLSRTQWQERIDEGAVFVNRQAVRASRKVQPSDSIVFSYPMRDEPEVQTKLPILFEDEHYWAVDKPAGLPVHPSGIYKTRTVVTVLAQLEKYHKPYLLHRLDRETSGVLLLAKHQKAAAAFQRVTKEKAIQKKYRVAVEGCPDEPWEAKGFLFCLPQTPLPRQRFFAPVAPENAIDAQTCHTRFAPLKHKMGLTLLEAELFTGRMHQIRATLKSQALPVVGDKLYGVDPNLYFRFADDALTDDDWRRLRISRSALHCTQMALQHPMTGAAWQIDSPLPQDIAGLF